MKIKIAKTAKCGYIYADGHAVITHEETHAKAGRVEWIEIFEKLDISCQFEGRIVFHHLNYDRRFQLACDAYSLRCTEPSESAGSENSKKLGLSVQHFEIGYRDGKDLSWTLFPGVISDGITYQPETKEAFNPDWSTYDTWGLSRIAVIHRLPKAEVREAVAA